MRSSCPTAHGIPSGRARRGDPADAPRGRAGWPSELLARPPTPTPSASSRRSDRSSRPRGTPRRGPASGSPRTSHLLGHGPGRLLGRRRRTARLVGLRGVVPARPAVGARVVRRAARACRARASAGRSSRRRCRTRAAACAGCSRRARTRRPTAATGCAGFTLHPELHLSGVPRPQRASRWWSTSATGTPGDFDLMDSLDRQRRDAAHGPDHPLLASHAPAPGHRPPDRLGLRLPARSRGRRCCSPPSNRRTAARLLWEAIASAPRGRAAGDRRTSRRPTSGPSTSGWRHGCRCRHVGYLALRGMRPPTPYLHHGSLL